MIKVLMHFPPMCILSWRFLEDYSSDRFQILYKIQIQKMCNVIVLIDKIKNCQNFKNVGGLSAFLNQCTFCSTGFSKKVHPIILYTASTDIRDVQLRSFD